MAVDGSIILCTESGHAFLRTRNPKTTQAGTKTFKFRRVPYIQRVTSVYCNDMGAFAALRADFSLDPICLTGNLLHEDLARLLPFWDHHPTWPGLPPTPEDNLFDGADQEEEGNSLGEDVLCMRGLCDFLFPISLEDPDSKIPEGAYKSPGADVTIRIQEGFEVPAHRYILVVRSSVLSSLLSGQTGVVKDPSSGIVVEVSLERSEKHPGMTALSITGCHAISVLILLYYLYSDGVLAIWDPRVPRDVIARVQIYGKISPHQVRAELKDLARILELPLFERSLRAVTKLTPNTSITEDFSCAFSAMQDPTRREVYKPDVVLELADRTVYCHSAGLRGRSELFAAFFDDGDWTKRRWTPEGTIVVDLKHMKWRPMEYVLKFWCEGGDVDMFDSLGEILLPFSRVANLCLSDHIESSEDLLNLMLEIIVVSVRCRFHVFYFNRLTPSLERVARQPIEPHLLLDNTEALQPE